MSLRYSIEWMKIFGCDSKVTQKMLWLFRISSLVSDVRVLSFQVNVFTQFMNCELQTKVMLVGCLSMETMETTTFFKWRLEMCLSTFRLLTIDVAYLFIELCSSLIIQSTTPAHSKRISTVFVAFCFLIGMMFDWIHEYFSSLYNFV